MIRQASTTRERVLRANRALMNGSGKLAYFRNRGLETKVVRKAWLGSEGGAILYPCFARDGGVLGIHFKSEGRDMRGKRRQWWDSYSPDLPFKADGQPAKVIPFGMETLRNLDSGSLVVLCAGEEDAMSLRQIGYTALSQPGAGLLEPVYARELAGFEVVVFYDAGEEEEALKDARKLVEAGARWSR